MSNSNCQEKRLFELRMVGVVGLNYCDKVEQGRILLFQVGMKLELAGVWDMTILFYIYSK